eukprot:14177-Heterococcus_DN1.PRE.2
MAMLDNIAPLATLQSAHTSAKNESTMLTLHRPQSSSYKFFERASSFSREVMDSTALVVPCSLDSRMCLTRSSCRSAVQKLGAQLVAKPSYVVVQSESLTCTTQAKALGSVATAEHNRESGARTC